MKKIVSFSLSFLLCACMLCASLTASAQEPEDPCTDPADPCPIDTNVALFVVAALGVGAKKAYDYRKALL